VTLLLDVALAATMLFAAGSVATCCLGSASADVRRTIWRAVFTGVVALPVMLAFEQPQAAAQFVAVVPVPSAVSAVSRNVADVPWLVLIWAVGFAFVMGRLTAGLAQVRRWARGAIAGDQADFSLAITVPMTWGVVRPQILLPADARTWPEDARDLVVRHEAAHVASHDWAWQTMARVVTAALWFHPLAWFADQRLRREAERAADDAVLAGGANPADYADELVRVARSMTATPATTIAAVGMVERSSLEQRVRHVLDRHAGRGPASWLVRAIVAVFVAALSVSAAAMQDQPVYKVGDDGVTAPKVVKEARPSYSQDAMERKVEGEVLLEAVVTEEGLPTDIRVVKPLDASLDRAAIEAAMQWRFEPGRRNDQPVRVRVHLQFSFTLK
jgi:TonB family protein